MHADAHMHAHALAHMQMQTHIRASDLLPLELCDCMTDGEVSMACYETLNLSFV